MCCTLNVKVLCLSQFFGFYFLQNVKMLVRMSFTTLLQYLTFNFFQLCVSFLRLLRSNTFLFLRIETSFISLYMLPMSILRKNACFLHIFLALFSFKNAYFANILSITVFSSKNFERKKHFLNQYSYASVECRTSPKIQKFNVITINQKMQAYHSQNWFYLHIFFPINRRLGVKPVKMEVIGN